jgi:hypothetical protein
MTAFGRRRVWCGIVTTASWSLEKDGLVPPDGVPTIDDIRKRVIRELVDLEIVSARRLTMRTRIARRVRRRIGIH